MCLIVAPRSGSVSRFPTCASDPATVFVARAVARSEDADDAAGTWEGLIRDSCEGVGAVTSVPGSEGNLGELSGMGAVRLSTTVGLPGHVPPLLFQASALLNARLRAQAEDGAFPLSAWSSSQAAQSGVWATPTQIHIVQLDNLSVLR
jgi:hypothetical protein